MLNLNVRSWIAAASAAMLLLVAGCGSTGPADRADARPVQNPDQRIALVIGNSRYAESPLVNPANDARAMSATLAALGFNVTSLYDASLTDMNDAARKFGDKLRVGGVGLFFYAGHGMQIRGRNYLIPVSADIKREEDVQFKAFDANQLLDKMESAKNPINIVILDACRNNPFVRSFRSAASGLAQMDAPVGTYLSYSTAPGKVASDGEGENGLFTQHLLSALRTPGQKVEDVFKQVRVKVMQDSGGQQVPWDSSSLTGDFYFVKSNMPLPTLADAQVPRTTPVRAAGVQSISAPTTAASPTTPTITSVLPGSPAVPASASPAATASGSTAGSTTAASSASTSPAKGARSASASSSTAGSASAPSVVGAASARGGGEDAYRRGLEAQKKGDFAGAYDAFAQAAEQGNGAAEYELAMLLKVGRAPVKQDISQARRWLTKAAEHGHTAGQYELGLLMEKGTGGEKNCREAEKWLRKAAERAHTDAMVQLGWMNLRGCEGEKNPSEAAKWLKLAAAKGSRDAQFSLGVLYFNGDGVTKDSREARKLLEAAASKGHPSAKFYLDRLQ